MDKRIIFIIISMAAVSYLPRALPLVALSKMEFHPILKRWLNFIPGAVLAALLAPELFAPNSGIYLSFHNFYLLAAVPTLLIGVISKSMVWTLLAGMASFAVLQLFLA